MSFESEFGDFIFYSNLIDSFKYENYWSYENANIQGLLYSNCNVYEGEGRIKRFVKFVREISGNLDLKSNKLQSIIHRLSSPFHQNRNTDQKIK